MGVAQILSKHLLLKVTLNQFLDMTDVKCKGQPSSESAGSSTGVEFNLHSSCYNDFFLLRTPITNNGRPAVIKIVSGEPVLRARGISVKLSTILQHSVAPVASKHGVYSVDKIYCERVPLFLATFRSKLLLKQFLSDKEAVQKELSSTIANLLEKASKQCQSSKSAPSTDQFQIAVEVKVYLVSPAVGQQPVVNEINFANHSMMIEAWNRSKLFDFTSTMFTKPSPGASGIPVEPLVYPSPLTLTSQEDKSGENTTLAALQVELREVVEWFILGVELQIPVGELMTIRQDHHYTNNCRLEMLIRWSQLEKPTWSKLVPALVNIGRRGLAEKIAKKHGVPLPSNVTIEDKVGTHVLEDEVERATQSRDAVSKALEMDIDTTLPELQMKVSSLSQDVRLLKTKLKNREEENQMLKEAQQSLKQWNEAIQRTRRENSEAIKILREEIKKKEEELAQTKACLADKEKELSEKMKELDMKSARVFELQSALEEMKRNFSNQQKEMDIKFIETKALAQSQEKYLEEIEIRQDAALKEARKKKEEIDFYTQEVIDKEKQIRHLSEKIVEQEREMAKLREELDSSNSCSSEQLSAEEDDERKQELLHTLITTTMKLQLELREIEVKKYQNKINLEGAKKEVEKHNAELSSQKSDVKVQSSAVKTVTLQKRNQTSSLELSSQKANVKDPQSLAESVETDESTHDQNNQGFPLSVVALYSFTGRSEKELSFKDGDVLQVTQKWSTEWWYGMDIDGRHGCIPINYVKIQESEETPLAEPKLPRLELKWRRSNDIPFGIWGGSTAVVMKGEIYIGGGIALSSKDEQTVCVYCPHSSDSWSKLTQYKYRYFGLAVVNANQLVTVGGQDVKTEKKTNKLGIWDSKRRKWIHTLPPMHTACHSPAVTTYNQWLLVAGGEDKQGYLSRVEVMNISTKQWYNVSPLPVAGYQMSSSMIENTWIVSGGFNDQGSSKSVMSVCVEDIISEAISQSTGANHSSSLSKWNSLPNTPLAKSTVLVFQGALLAIGGGASSIYLFQPSISKWIKVGDMPRGRSMPACTLLPNGDIMIAGGHGAKNRVDITKVM